MTSRRAVTNLLPSPGRGKSRYPNDMDNSRMVKNTASDSAHAAGRRRSIDVHPVLMPKFGDGSGTDFSIGFGVDAKLNNRLDIRFSAALGDRDGIAFTVAWVR